jgi:hypothetical protein
MPGQDGEMATDGRELRLRDQLLRLLAGLGGEVGCGGVGQEHLASRSTKVGEGEIHALREGGRAGGEAAKRGLGIAQLIIGQKRRRGADAAGGLQRLQLKGGFLGGGFLLGFKILTETDAMEPTGDAP